MFSCTTKHYDRIYAPWIARGTDLLDWSGWQPNQQILDLCGGTGVIATQAVAQGAQHPVHLFDLNPRCNIQGVIQTKGDANHVGDYYEPNTFDVVVCRQAMAYLDPDVFFDSVAKVIKPGGCLVFNTFWNSPPTVGFKTMVFKGTRFAEAHINLFDRIVHLQVRLDWPLMADVSIFRHHHFMSMWLRMGRHFEPQADCQGKSARVRGLRKSE